MRELTCAEVDDSAPAYALDILEGSRRSLVDAHVLGCDRCRETVTRTQASADHLLDVSSSGDGGNFPRRPSAQAGGSHPGPGSGMEPVAGVEGDSPFEEWGDQGGEWERPRRRLRVAAAVVSVVALMVGTTVGPDLEAATRPKPVLTMAVPLVAGSTPVGSVRVYAGRPPVIEIEVTGIGGRQTLHADLIDSHGHIEPFGSFRVVGGQADWAAPEPRGVPAPRDLVLADSSGKVLAQASLS